MILSGTIIYYGGFHLPDKNAAANRVVANGKLFDKLGFKTVFLGADYDNSFLGVRKISENMYTERHPEGTAQWLKSMLLFKNLKRLSADYDDLKLVILYNVPFVTLVFAKIFFKSSGIDIAYDCTEWTKFTEGSVLKKAFKLIDEFFICRFSHFVADKMIVISKTMERAYKRCKRLVLLPPLVDIDDDIWHQQGINAYDDSFVFCFAGFPEGNKDSLSEAVEAFISLNKANTIMNVVGLTSEDFLKKYPHMKNKLKNTDNIVFLGARTHEDAILNILSCDCYVFVREADKRNNAGFPTKFTESYTCGVPIITTDISDISDYASDDRVIILDSPNVSAIADAMQVVIDKGKSKSKNLNVSFDYNEFTDSARSWLID